MTIYVTTTSDIIKHQKIFASLLKDDELQILYTDKNASIPIEAYQILSSLKCSVNFEPFPETQEEQFLYVFKLGKRCGEKNNAAIRGITDTKNGTIGALLGALDGKSQGKTQRKRSAAARPKKESPVEEPFMPAPTMDNTTPVLDPQQNDEVAEKKKRTRKQKQGTANVADDAFERAYGELMELLEGVKTKGFDPARQVTSIVKAVKTSQNEGKSLNESFNIWFSGNANKYIKAFSGKEDDLFRIVSALGEDA